MRKVTVITGGSRGIGKATAAYYLSQGWMVINLSRGACELPDVINLKMDLMDANSIHAIRPELIALCRGANQIALLHNAAFLNHDSVSSMVLSDLESALKVNVTHPILLNQILIPIMPAGSLILYVGSALAEMAVKGFASYSISKHALIGLMRATCQDLGDRAIRSLCICPGLVDTQLLRQSMDDEAIEWLKANKIIAKRLIKPKEIAEFIYQLTIMPILNGQVIHADFGQYTN